MYCVFHLEDGRIDSSGPLALGSRPATPALAPLLPASTETAITRLIKCAQSAKKCRFEPIISILGSVPSTASSRLEPSQPQPVWYRGTARLMQAPRRPHLDLFDL